MGKFFKSAKFRIILCIVALLIGIMLFAVTQKGYTLPETGVSLKMQSFLPFLFAVSIFTIF